MAVFGTNNLLYGAVWMHRDHFSHRAFSVRNLCSLLFATDVVLL